MFKLRVFSALIGIPLAILAAWHGGLILLFLVGAVMIKGILEMVRLLNNLDLRPNIWLTVSASLMLLLVAYWQEWQVTGVIFTILVISHLLLMVTYYPEYTFKDGAAGVFTTIYLSLFAYVYLLSTLPEGHYWLLLMIASTWASDTFAYGTGRYFGKRQLAPTISPNKTWEGAWGGLVGSVFGTMLAAYLFGIMTTPSFFVIMLLLGLLIGILGQLGDLVESILKRQANIKDSGTMIPGHGGVLDRFDSMLLSAPLVYYFVSVFII